MTTQASTSTSPPANSPPISRPVSTLHTQASHLYTSLHPILLLGSYYYFFPTLVASPLDTLTRALLPLAALQTLYCILCLPASAGSHPSQAGAGGKTTSKRKRVQFAHKPASVGASVIPALFALILTLALAAPFLTIVLVLFGAPLTTHLWHSLLAATHIALLGVLPLFYVHGVDTRVWREIAGARMPFDEVWGGMVGSLVGAWLGAVPIPLDWDREWQKWPVTIVTGAYMGWAMFRLGGEYLLKGKRIEFD